MEKHFFNIAIDGPAGSGKSTIAKKFAALNPNFIYINTGNMFRAIAFYLINNKIDFNNLELIKEKIKDLNIILKGDEVFIQVDNNASILNITKQISNLEVAKISSEIAKLDFVREKLLLLQREIASKQNVIMDGRDIGTKVLPNANIKIFLEASIEERAKRRQNELKEKNIDVDLPTLMQTIYERDLNDKTRAIAPLIKATDAIAIDTTYKTIDEVVELVNNLYLNSKHTN